LTAEFIERATHTFLPRAFMAKNDRRKNAGVVAPGKDFKMVSGIGQEAIAAALHLLWMKMNGSCLCIATLVYSPLEYALHNCLCNGREQGGYSKGRERSFHFGSKQHHICGMISHLGPQLAIADGVALAHKLKKQNKVSLAFTGEGGTSEGDFHEALNVAAVWDFQ
jgi:2-oxoisovalerate dehydrogenase E1 component